MKFYIGLHQPADAQHFDRAFISVSMAWSYAARREDRDANDWREARSFIKRINIARGHYARRHGAEPAS